MFVSFVSLRKRTENGKSFDRNFDVKNLREKEIFGEKFSPTESCFLDSTSIRIRSFVNYLEMSYFAWERFLSDDPNEKLSSNNETVKKFEFFLEKNENFGRILLKVLLKNKNLEKKILSNLILTQRYNLRSILSSNDETVLMQICLLTFYRTFSTSSGRFLFSQLLQRLKSKILEGPIDSIEKNFSFFSLDQRTMLNDDFLNSKTIEIIVHITLTENDHIETFSQKFLTSDTISQVKEKILFHWNISNRIPPEKCQIQLIVDPNRFSSSSSSCSGSSSVPLTRKSLLTELHFNRTNKFSTLIYRNEMNFILLNDFDQTNQIINNGIKINTLQHYGIIQDGQEIRMFLPKDHFLYNREFSLFFEISR